MCHFHLPTNAFVRIRCLCQLQCLYLNHLNFLPLNFSFTYLPIHSFLSSPSIYFHKSTLVSPFLPLQAYELTVSVLPNTHCNPLLLFKSQSCRTRKTFKYFTIIYDSYRSCPLPSYFTLVGNILLMPQPLVHLKYVTYGSSMSSGLTIL